MTGVGQEGNRWLLKLAYQRVKHIMFTSVATDFFRHPDLPYLTIQWPTFPPWHSFRFSGYVLFVEHPFFYNVRTLCIVSSNRWKSEGFNLCRRTNKIIKYVKIKLRSWFSCLTHRGKESVSAPLCALIKLHSTCRTRRIDRKISTLKDSHSYSKT